MAIPPSVTSKLLEANVPVGLSSLSKLSVNSVVRVVPLIIVPGVMIIVSKTSTCSLFTADIDIIPLDEFAGIIISVALRVYLSELAVPESNIGMVISWPDTGVDVAVNVTESLEFSTKFSLDNVKVTAAESSSSVIVMFKGEVSDKEPLEGTPGVILIVSSASSELSGVVWNKIVAEVSPAAIENWGENWYLYKVGAAPDKTTRLFSLLNIKS